MTAAHSLNKIIYADNAATTKIDKDALKLMIDLQKNFFANPSSSYKIARPLKKILDESREKIAACINANPNEILFTSGGTESNNWAIKNYVLAYLYDKPNMITSTIEHPSVLNSCHDMNLYCDCRIIKLPVNEKGLVNPADLWKKMTRRMQIVSVMLANNEIGTIQPIKELAEIAHVRGKIFHTDAVQAAGHIPIDVKDLEVDMLSASAHKFNGPKGIGFLYASPKNMSIFSYISGGGQELHMRGGTENVPAIAAMALALEKNCRDMKKISKKVSTCSKILLDCLRKNNVDFILNGAENRLPGNLSLSFKNFDGEGLMHRLDLKNICVSTGSACHSNYEIISHVLKEINVPPEYIQGTIRITFGKENTFEDAKIIGENLIKILLRDEE